MKYLYLNIEEDRVCAISIKRPDSIVLDTNFVEYVVPDDFNLSKEMDDGEGNLTLLDGFLTASEFLARYNTDYIAKRTGAYPDIGDQLDALFKAGAFPADMSAQIQAVKDANPKPTGE